MIISLEGQLEVRTLLGCILSVHGVGYEIFVPVSMNLPPIGERVKLFTYAVYREDSQALYGFGTLRERDFFKLVVEKVSGIGPKTALAMFSKFPLEMIQRWIAQRDAKSIAQVPGIGKKTAEKLILELEDKVHIDGIFSEESVTTAQNDAILGLIALGYKKTEAESMIRVIAEKNPDATAEKLIKQAIRIP